MAPSRPRLRVLRHGAAPAALLVLLGVAGLLDGLACGLTRSSRVPPVAPTASMSFAAAQRALREGDEEAARIGLERAASVAPDWLAPQRALDDLDRADLLGAEVLERRRRELADRPGSAPAAYLVGRLEGPAGVARFEQAVERRPDLAWLHHGLAWSTHAAGQTRDAVRHGRRAMELARDTWERSTFAVALARYHLALGRPERALEVLQARLAEPDVLEDDARTLEAWLARSELESGSAVRSERGFVRGLELLIDHDLGDDELATLVRAMVAAPGGRTPRELALELGAALAARDGALRRRLRAELELEAGSAGMALALATDRDEASLLDRELFAARFAAGEPRAAVDAWVDSLPAFLLDDHGLPRDERVAAVVLVARDGDEEALGEALVAAGWYAEARAHAEAIAARRPELALSLHDRASAGLALLSGVGRLLRAVDRGRPHAGPWSPDARISPDELDRRLGAKPIRSLDDLLAAMEPLFDAWGRASGESAEAPRLLASPRTSYGPFGVVLHPGPHFSARDAASGLGGSGEVVAGLAQALDRMGRFGIFGQAMGGGGPDGTLLRRVVVEERSGEHLGVRWSGIVAWCEGADVASRPGRRGASISGAALHEGYWIDLAGIRGEHAAWTALQREFFGPGSDPARVGRALASRGVTVDPRATDLAERRVELVPLLGQAERVRLAVLADRARERSTARPLVDLEELALVTATHEEGHLCDRERYLPLGRNLLGAVALLARANFSPTGLAGLLEYRAQLVAMCEVDDPRLVLAECLAAAERGTGATPHARAYRDLLQDLLELLEEETRRDPDRWPSLSPDHVLVHQTHHLGPEQVRWLALELARDRGMIGRRL